jgi:hypothetical protein
MEAREAEEVPGWKVKEGGRGLSKSATLATHRHGQPPIAHKHCGYSDS